MHSLVLETILILFMYFWLHWIFVAALGLSLVGGEQRLLCCGVRVSHCGGFLRLRSTGSRCVGFSSCSTQAQ